MNPWDEDEQSRKINDEDKEFFQQNNYMVQDQLNELNHLIEDQE